MIESKKPIKKEEPNNSNLSTTKLSTEANDKINITVI